MISNWKNLFREDLNDEQKKIIKNSTFWYRVVWIFLPWIFILWARSYWIFVIFLIVGAVISLLPEDLRILFILVWAVLSRVRLYTQWSKRAFDESKWYLKDMIKPHKWKDIIKKVCLNKKNIWKNINIEWFDMYIKKNIKIWDTIKVSSEGNEWTCWGKKWDLFFVIVDIK